MPPGYLTNSAGTIPSSAVLTLREFPWWSWQSITKGVIEQFIPHVSADFGPSIYRRFPHLAYKDHFQHQFKQFYWGYHCGQHRLLAHCCMLIAVASSGTWCTNLTALTVLQVAHSLLSPPRLPVFFDGRRGRNSGSSMGRFQPPGVPCRSATEAAHDLMKGWGRDEMKRWNVAFISKRNNVAYVCVCRMSTCMYIAHTDYISVFYVEMSAYICIGGATHRARKRPYNPKQWHVPCPQQDKQSLQSTGWKSAGLVTPSWSNGVQICADNAWLVYFNFLVAGW